MQTIDQRIVYIVRRYSSKIWLVLKKGVGTKPRSLDASQKLHYDRIRTVSIDPEGVMSCNCGKM